MRKVALTLLALGLANIMCVAYGNQGHGLVGATADQLLKKNATIQAKVSKLLDGMSLAGGL